MKIPQSASLTATAALLLHFGSFVQANPMFVEIPPAHNDASETTCGATRITYPAGKDIVFGNDTNHVVAWNVPSFVSQVNLTLVGQNYVSYLDTFPAKKGASNIPFVLSNGAQAGEYHVHLATIGGEQSCETDSSPFTIEASAQTQQPGDEADAHSDKSWDAMLTELGQYVDKDDDKDAESHKDAAPKSEDEENETFDAYIKSLDMDYAPYIEKNKDSESDVVTHKNSGADFAEDQHDDAANPYFTNDDQRTHTDAANPYFTNDDQRTHTDAHLDAELDQLSHTDAPFFQGTGGAPSIKTQKIEGGEGDEGWTIEEYPYPVNEWVDESDDIADHSDQGEWMEEELDPSAVVHSDADDWAEETSTKTPFDHTDVGTWSAEEIDEAPEPKVAKEHLDAVGWVESESSHSNDGDIPDHSNDSEWHVDEVDFEYDTAAHTDKAQGEWVETDSSHPDDANGWTEETSTQHGDSEWQEETSTAHRDSDWQEETSTAHRDSSEWQEEDSEHEDASGWQSEASDDQHYDDNVLIYAAEDFIN